MSHSKTNWRRVSKAMLKSSEPSLSGVGQLSKLSYMRFFDHLSVSLPLDCLLATYFTFFSETLDNFHQTWQKVSLIEGNEVSSSIYFSKTMGYFQQLTFSVYFFTVIYQEINKTHDKSCNIESHWSCIESSGTVMLPLLSCLWAARIDPCI